jgi:hypothetical protein
MGWLEHQLVTRLTAVLDVPLSVLPTYLVLPCRSLAQQLAHWIVPQTCRQSAGCRIGQGMMYLHVRFDPSSGRRAIEANHLRRSCPDAGG